MRSLIVRAEAGGVTAEQPPAILREPELRARLQVVDADRTFARRSSAAILRQFIDTGAGWAELANLSWTPAEPDTNNVDLNSGLVLVMGPREWLLPSGRSRSRRSTGTSTCARATPRSTKMGM